MRILPNGIAVLDQRDQLCEWIEESGKLCHDDGVALHYLPHITPGRQVVDGGAALGDHTIAYMEKAGSPELVHAFEPGPEMVECLRYNCPGANIYPLALSDRHEGLWFHRECKSTLGPFTNVGASHLSSIDQSDVMVNAVTLDSLHLQDVGFIKLDLEGFEFFAIRGATETIQRCRPAMMVEMNPLMLFRYGVRPKMLYDLLEKLGYSYSVVMGDESISDSGLELLCRPK